jgi:hypothetical protein
MDKLFWLAVLIYLGTMGFCVAREWFKHGPVRALAATVLLSVLPAFLWVMGMTVVNFVYN